MKTECEPTEIEFQELGRRNVVGNFLGGSNSSDAGGLLLRELEESLGILKHLSECFTDHRNPDQIEHTVLDLVSKRTYGLMLGYDDLNDHDDLHADPLLATLVGKEDPHGENRHGFSAKGKALAGKTTLNRLELTA